jgi:hypothetical protein
MAAFFSKASNSNEVLLVPKIQIDTDEAVIYDKISHFVRILDEDNKRKRAFTQEQIKLETTFLTACIAVYIEAEEEIIALHVSPFQANNSEPAIKAYAHLEMADTLKKGTEISVIIGGHTQNFNEAIFMEKINKMGLILTQLVKGDDSPSHLLQAEFDLENHTMQVIKFSAKKDDPDRTETLSLSRPSMRLSS